MSAVQLLITTAGLDALVNAQGGNTEAIRVTSVGLTQTPFTMAPTIEALPGEMKRLETISGKSVSDTIVHMTAQDNSTDVYDLHGFGLYLADGTLFAIFSQITPIFRKVSIASLMLAMDIAFANGDTGSIEFGDTSFLLPPATETVKGVAEVATPEEAAARADHGRFITPLTLGQQLVAERSESDADISALAEAFNALINALMARTITGAGLVTGGGDLLASRVLQVLAASATDIRTGTATDRAATPKALADTFGVDIAALLARAVTGGGLVTGGGNLSADRVLQVLAASAADIRTGTAVDRAATPKALADTFGADIAALLARAVTGGGLVTGGGTLSADRVLQVLAASAADIRSGTAVDRAATPKALADTFGADIAALLARTVTGSGLVTGGGNLSASRVLQVLAASATDIRTGTAVDRAATPKSLADTFGVDIAALLARTVTGSGLVTGGGNLSADRVLQVLAASAADVDAGTDTTKAITPAALSGLIRLLGQNGYAKLPGLGGLIVQWGRFSAVANGTTTTVFPLAFPTACFSVVCTGGAQGGNDSQDNPPVVIASGIERSGFAVFSADDSAAICCYITLGI